MESENQVDAAPSALRCSTAKLCDFVHELESALSFVTDECRLASQVEVFYESRDGEGFMRVTCKEDREDAEAYRRLKRGLAESHKASIGKDCVVWDSRNVGQ